MNEEIKLKEWGRSEGYCYWHPKHGWDLRTIQASSYLCELGKMELNLFNLHKLDVLTPEEQLKREEDDKLWRMRPFRIEMVALDDEV